MKESYIELDKKIELLLISPHYSKVVAYREVGENEDIRIGDRLFRLTAFPLSSESSLIGKKKKSIMWENIKIYRPLILISLLEEDKEERKLYVVNK